MGSRSYKTMAWVGGEKVLEPKWRPEMRPCSAPCARGTTLWNAILYQDLHSLNGTASPQARHRRKCPEPQGGTHKKSNATEGPATPERRHAVRAEATKGAIQRPPPPMDSVPWEQAADPISEKYFPST